MQSQDISFSKTAQHVPLIAMLVIFLFWLLGHTRAREFFFSFFLKKLVQQ